MSCAYGACGQAVQSWVTFLPFDVHACYGALRMRGCSVRSFDLTPRIRPAQARPAGPPGSGGAPRCRP